MLALSTVLPYLAGEIDNNVEVRYLLRQDGIRTCGGCDVWRAFLPVMPEPA